MNKPTTMGDVRQTLSERQAVLKKRLGAIEADVRHDKAPLSSDWSEQAVEKENDEVIDALGNAALLELRQIRNALQRIDAGEYGYCSRCGTEIGVERQQLLPYTDLCIKCSELLEAD